LALIPGLAPVTVLAVSLLLLLPSIMFINRDSNSVDFLWGWRCGVVSSSRFSLRPSCRFFLPPPLPRSPEDYLSTPEELLAPSTGMISLVNIFIASLQCSLLCISVEFRESLAVCSRKDAHMRGGMETAPYKDA
jgi:hypothetical protein